jgi:hypothetical protein
MIRSTSLRDFTHCESGGITAFIAAISHLLARATKRFYLQKCDVKTER